MATQFSLVHMDDLRRIASRAGSYWFAPDTVAFFRSRLAHHACWIPTGDADRDADGEGTYFFVSSEKGPSGQRRYSVRQHVVTREARPDGYLALRYRTETVGGFQEHETRAQAQAALLRAIDQAKE